MTIIRWVSDPPFLISVFKLSLFNTKKYFE